jgi:hypothetical protein
VDVHVRLPIRFADEGKIKDQFLTLNASYAMRVCPCSANDR